MVSQLVLTNITFGRPAGRKGRRRFFARRGAKIALGLLSEIGEDRERSGDQPEKSAMSQPLVQSSFRSSGDLPNRSGREL